MRDKVPARSIRERGARAARDRRRAVAAFRQSQVGTVRPGLTLEDGTLVVTDNYLKVRIRAGLPRNARVTSSRAVSATVVERRLSDCR